MTEFFDRLDPEFAPLFSAEAPKLSELLQNDVVSTREFFAQMLTALASTLPPFEGSKESYNIPGLEDDPEVPVIEFRKHDMLHPDCVVVWLHGGGYLIGDADDNTVHPYASLAPTVSVEYRMAPEHRAPAAARDACAAIEWVQKKYNPRKIIVAGASAGAGLSASAALLNRDRGGPQLDFQLLIYPMLDDKHDTASGSMDIPVSGWNRDVSLYAWSVYAEEAGASPYAAAARADDLSGLPPAYIMSGDLDLFLDDDIAYANRLRAAGVPVELAIFPNAPHGFNTFNPVALVSQRANASIQMALEHAMK